LWTWRQAINLTTHKQQPINQLTPTETNDRRTNRTRGHKKHNKTSTSRYDCRPQPCGDVFVLPRHWKTDLLSESTGADPRNTLACAGPSSPEVCVSGRGRAVLDATCQTSHEPRGPRIKTHTQPETTAAVSPEGPPGRKLLIQTRADIAGRPALPYLLLLLLLPRSIRTTRC